MPAQRVNSKRNRINGSDCRYTQEEQQQDMRYEMAAESEIRARILLENESARDVRKCLAQEKMPIKSYRGEP